MARSMIPFIAFASLALAASSGAVDGTLVGRNLQKNVQLVYLEKVEGAGAVKPTEGAVLDQKGNTYHPHVLPVVVGSTVKIQSSDPELHNVYAMKGAEVLFNSGMPVGTAPRNRTFDVACSRICLIADSIRSRMMVSTSRPT